MRSVYCPWKAGEIAVSRCAEYQAECPRCPLGVVALGTHLELMAMVAAAVPAPKPRTSPCWRSCVICGTKFKARHRLDKTCSLPCRTERLARKAEGKR